MRRLTALALVLVCLTPCAGPVSYTHLDVYKRQDDTLAATATAEWLMDIAGQAPA